MPSMDGHGGKREGAGRKSLEEQYGERVVTMTVRLPESQYAFVSSKGMSAAEYIRELIARDMARPSPHEPPQESE